MLNKTFEQVKNEFKVGDIIMYQPQFEIYHNNCRVVDKTLATIFLKIDAISDRAIYFDTDWMSQSLMSGGLNHHLLFWGEKFNLFAESDRCYSLEWWTADDRVEYSTSSITLRKSNRSKIDVEFYKYDEIYNEKSIKQQLTGEIDNLIGEITDIEEGLIRLNAAQDKEIALDFNSAIKNGEYNLCAEKIQIMLHNRAKINEENNNLNQQKNKLTNLEAKLRELE